MTHEEFSKQLTKLVNNYRPNPEVQEHIHKLVLLMIIGPSGAGKTSLIDRLDFPYVISDTTRAPRPDEQEGADYYFRTDYEKIVDEIRSRSFAQIAVDSGGDLKATRDISYPATGTAVMAVVSDVVPTFRKLGFRKTISAFVVPPSYEEWMRRMSVHLATDDQRSKRLAEARRSFEFALNDKQTRFIFNDVLDEAVRQLEDLVDGKADLEHEAQGRAAARSILDELSR